MSFMDPIEPRVVTRTLKGTLVGSPVIMREIEQQLTTLVGKEDIALLTSLDETGSAKTFLTDPARLPRLYAEITDSTAFDEDSSTTKPKTRVEIEISFRSFSSLQQALAELGDEEQDFVLVDTRTINDPELQSLEHDRRALEVGLTLRAADPTAMAEIFLLTERLQEATIEALLWPPLQVFRPIEVYSEPTEMKILRTNLIEQGFDVEDPELWTREVGVRSTFYSYIWYVIRPREETTSGYEGFNAGRRALNHAFNRKALVPTLLVYVVEEDAINLSATNSREPYRGLTGNEQADRDIRTRLDMGTAALAAHPNLRGKGFQMRGDQLLWLIFGHITTTSSVDVIELFEELNERYDHEIDQRYPPEVQQQGFWYYPSKSNRELVVARTIRYTSAGSEITRNILRIGGGGKRMQALFLLIEKVRNPIDEQVRNWFRQANKVARDGHPSIEEAQLHCPPEHRSQVEQRVGEIMARIKSRFVLASRKDERQVLEEIKTERES